MKQQEAKVITIGNPTGINSQIANFYSPEQKPG